MWWSGREVGAIMDYRCRVARRCSSKDSRGVRAGGCAGGGCKQLWLVPAARYEGTAQRKPVQGKSCFFLFKRNALGTQSVDAYCSVRLTCASAESQQRNTALSRDCSVLELRMRGEGGRVSGSLAACLWSASAVWEGEKRARAQRSVFRARGSQ